mmetsp:Transcript_9125/g.16417  ORF Transcript_9125/g.16417 Transcript_9125/m.16417 type:complete len:362 (-) Transcript_9125:46-1131(-)
MDSVELNDSGGQGVEEEDDVKNYEDEVNEKQGSDQENDESGDGYESSENENDVDSDRDPDDPVETVVSDASAWFFGTLSSILPQSSNADTKVTQNENQNSGVGVDSSENEIQRSTIKNPQDSSELSFIQQQEQLLFSAASQVGTDVAVGFSSLNKLLDGMLDSSGTPGSAGNARHDDEDSRVGVSEQFIKLFGPIDNSAESIIGDDTILDSFSCCLMQKYRCYHNNLTPERMIPYRGKLFITESHVAFAETHPSVAKNAVFGASTDTQIQEPLRVVRDLKSVQKVQGSAPTQMLRLLLNDKSSIIFGSFKDTSEYNAVSALIEHLRAEDDNIAPPPPTNSASTETSEPQTSLETATKSNES